MYFYHGYALGVASAIPDKDFKGFSEFTDASCALSLRGGEAKASESRPKPATPPPNSPPGIWFDSAKSTITGAEVARNGFYTWVTEASVIIQKLNILDRFTADKIEAHLFSEYRAGDYEPSTVITGSKFDNVRIDGNLLQIDTADDLSEGYSTYSGMQIAFQNQFSQPSVLALLEGRGLDANTANTPDLRAAWEAFGEQEALGKRTTLPTLKSAVICSFVTKISGGGYKTWGPIVAVPNFGNIYLGELIVWPWMRCLNMFRIELASGGSICGGSAGANGTTQPPGGHPFSSDG